MFELVALVKDALKFALSEIQVRKKPIEERIEGETRGHILRDVLCGGCIESTNGRRRGGRLFDSGDRKGGQWDRKERQFSTFLSPGDMTRIIPSSVRPPTSYRIESFCNRTNAANPTLRQPISASPTTA